MAYFTIALGFLLYMQAGATSRRWWEGRVQWQRITETSKRLVLLLNTHLSCLRLTRYGTQMILANTICLRNLMQDRLDHVWERDLLEVMDVEKVDQIMKCPKRLRYLALLYGFQRLIQLSIETKILPKEVVR